MTTDEVPELDAAFFEEAILTRPGESIIEVVRVARKVTLESVTDWIYETRDTYTRPVPVMSREERETWHRLSNEEAVRKLTSDESSLLQALNRKLKYRVTYERAD